MNYTNDLSELTVVRADRPGVSSWASTPVDCAVGMFDSNGHSLPKTLRLGPRNAGAVEVLGPPCTDGIRASTGDEQEATEYGACAVIAQLVEQTHGQVILFRSPKNGEHFDYYLWPVGSSLPRLGMSKSEWYDFAIGASSARLEVSGISGDSDSVADRLSEKKSLFPSGRSARPVIIGIVDFRKLGVRIEKLD